MSKDWLSWDKLYQEEEEKRRNIDFSKLCNYGIKPLDDALLAIAPNELVIIGADSGVGKSEAVLEMAQYNAKRNKRVAVFYLEGGYLEAMQRMKWKEICDMYYTNRIHNEYIPMDFRSWVLNNNVNPKIHDLSTKVYAENKEKYKDNLFLYPISQDFHLEELLSSIMDFHKLSETKFGPFSHEGIYDLDLIIIDHLQYFSLDQSESEIKEITRIIRECKKITDYKNIPIILVSHLRKKGKDRGLPDQEDFYGSSNIPKIASTAICLSPCSAKDNFGENVFPTFFRVVKSRIGIRSNYAMLCNFDLTQRKYDNFYQLYGVDGAGNVSSEPMKPDNLPKWAKKEE